MRLLGLKTAALDEMGETLQLITSLMEVASFPRELASGCTLKVFQGLGGGICGIPPRHLSPVAGSQEC